MPDDIDPAGAEADPEIQLAEPPGGAPATPTTPSRPAGLPEGEPVPWATHQEAVSQFEKYRGQYENLEREFDSRLREQAQEQALAALRDLAGRSPVIREALYRAAYPGAGQQPQAPSAGGYENGAPTPGGYNEQAIQQLLTQQAQQQAQLMSLGEQQQAAAMYQQNAMLSDQIVTRMGAYPVFNEMSVKLLAEPLIAQKVAEAGRRADINAIVMSVANQFDAVNRTALERAGSTRAKNRALTAPGIPPRSPGSPTGAGRTPKDYRKEDPREDFTADVAELVARSRGL